MTIHWYPGHMHKASKILLSELRAGKLGRNTLETPKMIEQELIILQAKLEAEEFNPITILTHFSWFSLINYLSFTQLQL